MKSESEEFYRLLKHLVEHGFVRRSPFGDEVPEETLVELVERAVRDGVSEPPKLNFKETWTWWIAHMRINCGLDLVGFEQHDRETYKVTLKFRDGESYVELIQRKMLKEVGLRDLLRGLEGKVRAKFKVGGEFDGGDSYVEAIPDFMDYALGFRVWSVDGRGNLGPQSGGRGRAWDYAREIRAVCTNADSDHPAPQKDCSCGLHAYARASKVMYADGHWSHTSSGQIAGAVAARGLLVCHDDGFRAEFARPVVLGYDPGAVSREEEIGSVEVENVETQTMGGGPVRVMSGARTFRDKDGNIMRDPLTPSEERVSRIAARLGIPAVPLQHLEEVAQEYGEILPDRFFAPESERVEDEDAA